MTETSTLVTPPGNLQRLSGMHWLCYHLDGYAPVYVALQWNPGSETWTHSNEHSTYKGGRKLKSDSFRYVKPIPYPDFGS